MSDQALPLQFHHIKVDRVADSQVAPAWAGLVERWYQLDAPAFALAEAYWQLKDQLARPDLILLASPGASNVTDFEFARGGATSAAKFVHTLPNVRGTSLFQILQWSGPTLCLQNGAQTLLSALAEAGDEYAFEPREIWLFSVHETDVHLFRLSPALKMASLLYRRQAAGENKSAASAVVHKNSTENNVKTPQKTDADLTAWLSRPNPLGFTWATSDWERQLESTSL